jgi:hypothetical protein
MSWLIRAFYESPLSSAAAFPSRQRAGVGRIPRGHFAGEEFVVKRPERRVNRRTLTGTHNSDWWGYGPRSAVTRQVRRRATLVRSRILQARTGGHWVIDDAVRARTFVRLQALGGQVVCPTGHQQSSTSWTAHSSRSATGVSPNWRKDVGPGPSPWPHRRSNSRWVDHLAGGSRSRGQPRRYLTPGPSTASLR